MCGIVGFYNMDLSMDALLEQQQFRGPDTQGFCEIQLQNDEKLTLGHNRLKIVCLSDLANQPFVDPSRQHYLVFNGEIYNYLEVRDELTALGIKTITNSDTEILLLALIAWGMGALSKFNGMFAFAYFDSQRLYLVRDRFGVKPLYYYFENNKLVFASTSVLIAKTCQLSPNYSYLQYGIQYGIFQDQSDITAYTHLNAVPAGHYVVFRPGKSHEKSVVEYYNLNHAIEQNNTVRLNFNEQQLREITAEKLYHATVLRMRADVPIAVSLSGGLDSSIIAAMAKQINPQLLGFCFGDLCDLGSEARLAQMTAQRNQIELVFVNAKADDWFEALFETLKYQDAPFCGLSVVAQFLLYKKIKTHGFKVVLGGQGADEAFLGYRKFQLIYLKELIQKNNWTQALTFLTGFSKMAWSERRSLYKYWQMRAKYLKSSGFDKSLSLINESDFLSNNFTNGIRQRQIGDLTAYSLPTLLRYEDRNSMAHGIESRLPFMDYRLIEWACSLPVNVLLKNGYGKSILRTQFSQFIPEEIRLARYKRGFDVSCSKAILAALLPKLSANLAAIQNKLSHFMQIDTTRYTQIDAYDRHPNRFTELMALLWLNEKI